MQLVNFNGIFMLDISILFAKCKPNSCSHDREPNKNVAKSESKSIVCEAREKTGNYHQFIVT